jgi:hypothetical protein
VSAPAPIEIGRVTPSTVELRGPTVAVVQTCTDWIVRVHQDETRVWWVVTVETRHVGPSGGRLACGRTTRGLCVYAADEGGTHARHYLAALEASDIADRLRSYGWRAEVAS